MSAKLIKLVSGEVIAAEVINESMMDIIVKEALIVNTVFQDQKMGIRFSPFNPFATGPGEEITLSKTMIMFYSENADIIAEYNRITSKIVTAKVVPNIPNLSLAK